MLNLTNTTLLFSKKLGNSLYVLFYFSSKYATSKLASAKTVYKKVWI